MNSPSLAAEPLAVPVAEAARIVGLSRSQFYRVYIDSGRIKTIRTGKRDRVIDVPELKAAYAAFVIEERAAQVQ
jgi:hypothetical protein